MIGIMISMEKEALTRWQQFYSDDPKLGDVPPSACAKQAEEIFSQHNNQLILDVGCGTGRDTRYLAEGGARVIGLDAARSGLSLAQKRTAITQFQVLWVESDSRLLPFSDASFDGVYCFGLLHEFVGESAKTDVVRIMSEIHRILKSSGMVIIAVSAGDPQKGLPHVQNFSEAMFDAIIAEFHCVDKKVYDDLGCTGRQDYKVWFGHLVKD